MAMTSKAFRPNGRARNPLWAARISHPPFPARGPIAAWIKTDSGDKRPLRQISRINNGSWLFFNAAYLFFISPRCALVKVSERVACPCFDELWLGIFCVVWEFRFYFIICKWASI